jgi:hypothetical protein
MKFLVLSILILSCAPLSKADSEFISERQVSGITQKDMQLKINAFVNSYFNSGKSVTQSDHLGQFAGNGITPLQMGVLEPTSYLNYTFLIKYKDNAYKIKLIAKSVSTDQYPNGTIFEHHKKDIRSKFQAFDDDLYKFIKGESKDFDF